MELVLIGLGLVDEKDLTLRGLEEAKSCDKLYIEEYTGIWSGKIEKLEKFLGKKITKLERVDLEKFLENFLDENKGKKIGIFVQGDPLVQTTHSTLLLTARKEGWKTKVIHNSSIISAIGECGLHLQKFGSYVTIPFPERTKGKEPLSIYKTLKENYERNLHTLCLLDMIEEEKRYMSIKEGLEILLSLEGKFKDGIISKKSLIVGIARLGYEDQIIKFGELEKIIDFNFGKPPYVLIFPSKLHFSEKEFLHRFKI